MGSQKTLTNEKYMYNCKEFQIYKTKKGVKLIKINNSFVNINNVPSIHTKINEKNHNDMVAENISELNKLDMYEDDKEGNKVEALAEALAEAVGIASVISVSSETADVAELSESSIDGEEYVIL